MGTANWPRKKKLMPGAVNDMGIESKKLRAHNNKTPLGIVNGSETTNWSVKPRKPWGFNNIS